MPVKIITRRTAEVTDPTVHMPALVPVSRVPQFLATVTGLFAAAVFAVGVLFLAFGQGA